MRFLLSLFLFFGLVWADEIRYLIDEGNTSIEEMMQKPADAFLPYAQGKMGFGFTAQAYWLRIVVTNESAQNQEKVIAFDYPTLDTISMYETQAGTVIAQERYGDIVPNTRTQTLQIFFHTTTIAPQETKIYYARVTTQGSMILELSIDELQNFYPKMLTEHIGHFLYYGITLGLLIYNLFLFIGLKERTFFYYVMFHFWFVVVQISINGFGTWLLWGEWLWLNTFLTPFGMVLASLFGALFAHHFLSLTHRFLRVVVLVNAVALLAPFVASFGQATILAIFVSSLTVILMLGVAMYELVRGGNQQAKYFLIAWGGLLVGILLLNFKNSGLLPINFVTSYGSQLGAVFEMLLISVALIRKYNALQESLTKQAVLLDQQEAYSAKLLHQSRTDPLTGVYNRRYFFEKLTQTPPTHGLFLMMDLDYFKAINDTHGHDAGDAALIAFAHHVAAQLPKEAIFCRFGGEEFVAFVPYDTHDTPLKLAQHLVDTTPEIRLEKFPSVHLHVTIGVALCQAPIDIDSALKNADTALYRAKVAGRNRVVIFEA